MKNGWKERKNHKIRVNIYIFFKSGKCLKLCEAVEIVCRRGGQTLYKAMNITEESYQS